MSVPPPAAMASLRTSVCRSARCSASLPSRMTELCLRRRRESFTTCDTHGGGETKGERYQGRERKRERERERDQGRYNAYNECKVGQSTHTPPPSPPFPTTHNHNHTNTRAYLFVLVFIDRIQRGLGRLFPPKILRRLPRLLPLVLRLNRVLLRARPKQRPGTSEERTTHLRLARRRSWHLRCCHLSLTRRRGGNHTER